MESRWRRRRRVGRRLADRVRPLRRETDAYCFEAPQETGEYTFDPIEVSNDRGTTWNTIPETTDTTVVAGADQNDATPCTIGTVGLLAHQRDRIEQKTTDRLGIDRAEDE